LAGPPARPTTVATGRGRRLAEKDPEAAGRARQGARRRRASSAASDRIASAVRPVPISATAASYDIAAGISCSALAVPTATEA
jgi:hypothetical protein